MSSLQRRKTGEPTDGAADRSKDTLFCSVCGHKSTARDGDWAVTEREAAGNRLRAYECPDCWTTVLVQPVLEA